MGWTGFKTNDSFAQIFEHEFNQPGFDVIKYAEIKMPTENDDEIEHSEIYAAVKKLNNYIFGLVVIFKRYDNGEVLYKDMDESVGPYNNKCPENILNLLSPLNENSYTSYAKLWRERQQCVINKRLQKQSN